jgi:hypothetical protein
MTDYDDKEIAYVALVNTNLTKTEAKHFCKGILSRPIIMLDQCVASPDNLKKARRRFWREHVLTELSWRQRVKLFCNRHFVNIINSL